VKGLIHPFTGALYEQSGDGNIRVTHRGRVGIFTTDGRWLSGELRECDPHMCGWIAGPQIVSHRVGVESS
jgi:hypothetical protein